MFTRLFIALVIGLCSFVAVSAQTKLLAVSGYLRRPRRIYLRRRPLDRVDKRRNGCAADGASGSRNLREILA